MKYFSLFLTLLSMLMFMPFVTEAQETSGAFSGGSVKIGYDSRACAGSLEGALRYDSTGPKVEFCDGTNWTEPGGSCGVYLFDTFPFSQAATSAVANSDIVLVDTDACSASVSISGGSSAEYRICDNDTCGTVDHTWSSSDGTIDDGQYIQLRQTADATQGPIDTTTITVGLTLTDWSLQACPTTEYCGGRPDLKLAFQTSSGYNGDLEQEATDLGLSPSNGVDGADKICQKHADDADLVGTYYAWIASAASDDPVDRFTIAGTSLGFYEPLRAKIDDDWADLISGGIDNSLNVNENASSNGTGNKSWTAVHFAGYHTGADCTNWTSASGVQSGYTGRNNTTGSNWTADVNANCNSALRLYCFEQ